MISTLHAGRIDHTRPMAQSAAADPPVSRRRLLGLRLEPAYCAPIHVVGPDDVRAAIAFRSPSQAQGG
jgi:hypothetical protein